MEMIVSLLPLVVVFGVFWFMFIRPQRKRQEEYQDMLSNLERGDRVYTRGGLKGLVTKVQEDKLEIRIAPEVNVEVKRNGVAEVIEKAKGAASSDKEATQEESNEVAEEEGMAEQNE